MNCVEAAVFIFCRLFMVSLFNVGNTADVKTLDPGSLYKYFKQQSQGSAGNLPQGLAYFTPKTQKLVDSNVISREDITSIYKLMTNDYKKNLSMVQNMIKSCWDDVQNEGQSISTSYAYCYFQKAWYLSGWYSFWGYKPACSRNITMGKTLLRLMSCLTQEASQERSMLQLILPSQGRRATSQFVPSGALHIEVGFGRTDFGLYYSGSNGIALNLGDLSESMVTDTDCHGQKLDRDIGFHFSVSYLPNLGDVLGNATTVEIGVDLPFTDTGADLLLHFAWTNDGRLRFIGVGIAFGIGVGINPLPVDFAISQCNTRQVTNYAGSFVITSDSIVPGDRCTYDQLGVTSSEHICCPEPNRNCGNPPCWFSGNKCPPIRHNNWVQTCLCNIFNDHS